MRQLDPCEQFEHFTVRDGLVECRTDQVIPEGRRQNGTLTLRCWKCGREVSVQTTSRLAAVVAQALPVYGIRGVL